MLRSQAFRVTRRARGLSDIVAPVADALIAAHNASGLSWAALIATTTVLTRTSLTLPLTVYQQHILAKLELLKPEMATWAEALKYKVAVLSRREGKGPEEAQARLKSEVALLSWPLQSHPFR